MAVFGRLVFCLFFSEGRACFSDRGLVIPPDIWLQISRLRFTDAACILNSNKTPAQAFTPPANEKKMGTIWIFVYYAVYGSGRGRCRDFLVLKWGGGGLNLQIWDLNGAHETERTLFPILQVFSMCRGKL